MKAMLLAAGRGSRLRPLTDTIPKPIIDVAGKPLIVYTIERLRAAGITDIVINLAYKAEMIRQCLGDGSALGVNITYSPEPEGGLETGGGVFRALPLLGNEPFIVINADFYTDYPFEKLPKDPTGLVHLVLVDNPPDVQEGDFAFYDEQLFHNKAPNYYFAGIGVYRPELFKDCRPGIFSLTPMLRNAIYDHKATAEYYDGIWYEIGTPERYQALQDMLADRI